MELNREQIIKALECWASGKPCEGGKCDLLDVSTLTCDRWTGKNALSLINELTEGKAEIWEERNRIYNDLQDWKEIAEGYRKQFEDCAEDRAKLTEENENLHASCTELTRKLEGANLKIECKERILESYMLQYGTVADKEVWLKKERSDTVRKMQEAIKKYYSKPTYQPTKEHPIKHTQIEHLLCAIDQIAEEMIGEAK